MARNFEVQYVQYYTDGSAARKVVATEPVQTVRLPKAKKRKHIVLPVDPVAIGGIIMAMVMVVLFAVGVVQLREAKQGATQMAAYVDSLQAENVLLQETYEDSYDIANVEKTALALGLVPRDEVRQVRMQLPEVQEVNPGTWDRFCTFLAGLFA